MEGDGDADVGLVAVQSKKTEAVSTSAATARTIFCFFIIAIYMTANLRNLARLLKKLLLNRAGQKDKPPLPQFNGSRRRGLYLLQLSLYRVTSVTSLSPGLKTRPRHFFAEAL